MNDLNDDNEPLLIIGRCDLADFPELDLTDMEVKIDTGAYTAAIHCHNINETRKNGKPCLKFNLLDPSHPEYDNKECIVHQYSKTTVKSSTGHTENRFVIQTQIVLFNRAYDMELTLTDRSEMKYPILIGRKLLHGNFLVDVSKTNRSYNRKQNELQHEHSHTFSKA